MITVQIPLGCQLRAGHCDDVPALVELEGDGEAGVVEDGVRLHPQDPLRLGGGVGVQQLPQDPDLVPAPLLHNFSCRLTARQGSETGTVRVAL